MDTNPPAENVEPEIENITVIESPIPDKSLQNANINSRIIKIFGVLIVFLIALNGFLVYQFINARKAASIVQETLPNIDTSQQNDLAKIEDLPAQLVTHTGTSNEKYNYKISIPASFVKSKPQNVSINSLDDFRKAYQEQAEKGGCPGHCADLIEGDNLEKQFEMLSKVAKLPNCEMTSMLEEEIKNEFILFSGGPASIDVITAIYNPSLQTCGLKYLGNDGYDAWLGNFEYESGFIKDNKLIQIRFELYPIGSFKEIDDIWRNLGYNFEEESFSGEDNMDKMMDYMENVNFDDPVLKTAIELYDTSVKSFELVD